VRKDYNDDKSGKKRDYIAPYLISNQPLARHASMLQLVCQAAMSTRWIMFKAT
jgi:hypothetical protein